MSDQPQGQQIQIKIPEDILPGRYANMVQIVHTKEEFVLNFMNVLPPQGIISSRVIVNPAHMKRLAKAIAENVKRYEDQFGTIEEGSNPQPNFGFRTE